MRRNLQRIRIIQSNIIGADNLMEDATRYKVKRFIQVSTDEVYGQILKGSYKEDALLQPRNVYSWTKACADLITQEWCDAFGVKTVVNRFSCLAGEGQFGKSAQGWVAWWAIAYEFGLPLKYIGWKGKKSSDKEKMRIVPFADVWFGHHLHKEATFDERIAWIKDDPHVFCFLNGDIVHPFTARDRKEGKIQNIILPALMEKLRPIAHKILWAQAGCFEDKLMESKDSFDPVEFLCSEWDIPYFRDPVSVGIHWAGNLFEFFCIHGKSAANKKGSKLNAVLQVLSNIEFRHFIVMSHLKDSIFNKPVRVIPNIETFDMDERKQFVVTTPSFTRYKGSQGAKRGYQHPFSGQMNFTLYKDGDYHLYVSGVGSNFFELKGTSDGQK